jgi:hypothetical protein
MSLWSDGWTPENGWQVVVGREGGAVAKLSEMSFKKAIPGIVRQVNEIGLETSKLYRRRELEEWRGSTWGGHWWYNASFDARDARVVDVCLGIQQGLMSVQFYVDLWRSLFPGLNGAGGGNCMMKRWRAWEGWFLWRKWRKMRRRRCQMRRGGWTWGMRDRRAG